MGLVKSALRSLLPSGRAFWLRDQGDKVLDGVSVPIETAKTEARSVIPESWPGTAVDSLEAWHRTLGIKYNPGRTADDQRIMLEATETAKGGSSITLLQAQLNKEFPQVVVSESLFSSEAGDDECGVAECGAESGTVNYLSYDVTGEVPDDVSALRISAILKRYGPAHLSPNPILTNLAAISSSEAGEDESGLAVAEGYEVADLYAPSFTVSPYIAGIPSFGATIAAYPGVVDGAETPVLSYQWKLDTVDIDGATSNEHFVLEGGDYTCVVTATNSQGSDSETTAIVATPTILPYLVAPVPLMDDGTRYVIEPDVRGWPEPVVSYQWRIDGVDVPGEVATSILYDTNGPGTYDCVITATNSGGTSTLYSGTGTKVAAAPDLTWDGVMSQVMHPIFFTKMRTPTSHPATGFPKPTITYQWFKGASVVGTGGNFSEYPGVTAPAPGWKLTITATNAYGAESISSPTFNPW